MFISQPTGTRIIYAKQVSWFDWMDSTISMFDAIAIMGGVCLVLWMITIYMASRGSR
jgi:hypothetical protein